MRYPSSGWIGTVIALAAGAAAAQVIELLTVTPTGVRSTGDSTGPTLPGDGCFVVFNSVATNLVPRDTAGHQDVFVA